MVIFFGMLVGIALGLTGGGGSIFAMPLLLNWTDSTVTQAVALSALAVGSASLVGALTGLRNGLVDPRSGLMFAVTGVIAAPFGVRAGSFLADDARLAAFAVLLLAIGSLMWRKGRTGEPEIVRATVLTDSREDQARPACRYSPQGALRMTARCALVLMASGVAVGLLSGVFGVGGGFLIVPTLRVTTGLAMHRAVATSLLVIAMISASTVVSSWLHASDLDVALTWRFVLGSVIGLIAGSLVAGRLAGAALQRSFAGMIVAVGAAMLWQVYS